ncbi:MAG: hypothetical protein MI974_24740 [Chitinophagales bacterium]|nr:hypothetical protein [Chitinophagales bacterium]
MTSSRSVNAYTQCFLNQQLDVFKIRVSSIAGLIVLMFTFLLLPNQSIAQLFTCGNESESIQADNPLPSDDCFLPNTGGVVGNHPDFLADYYPDNDTPIKRIKVKIWIMQFAENDPRNFIDIPEHRNYWMSIISWANTYLSNLHPAHYGSSTPTPYPTGQPHISDSKFRLELEEDNINFVVDPLGWSNSNSTCSSYCYNEYGKDDCFYDIFVIGPGTSSGCAPGFGPHFQVVSNYWQYYQECTTPPFDCNVNQTHKAKNILHELGHNFGLKHSWDGQFGDILCPHCAGDKTGSCADPNECSPACYPSQDALCLNNIMAYTQQEKRNFTPLQLAAMHVKGFTKERVQYLDLNFDPSATISITGSEVWETARIIERDIIVPNSASLTVKCKLIMAPGATIQVEKGGELIVDNGHITTTSPKCGEYWGGIIAEGDGGANFLLSQGKVVLKNDALIEYAYTGIQLSKGAGLYAEDSEIKDCKYGVYFHPYINPVYDNYNPSRLKNCTFRITEEHMLGVEPLLSLRGVKNLKIDYCRFIDDRKEYIDVPYYYNLVSTGIVALNASFTVSGANTLFSGLLKGVEVGVSGTARNYTVKDATFKNCFLGIISRSVNNFTIRDNIFEIGEYDLSPIPQDDNTPPTFIEGMGISLQSGSGFTIKGNLFDGISWSNTTGIFVTNSGNEANIIEKNTFKELTFGNWVQGYNGGSLLGGLEYHCNKVAGLDAYTNYDYFVEDGGSIGRLQGRTNLAAGNTFHQGNSIPGSDFRNASTTNEVEYFYYFEQGEVEYEEPISTLNVEKIQVLAPNGNCLSNSGDHEEQLSEEEYLYYKNLFDTAKSTFGNQLTYYRSVLDGGNSIQLVDRINNPTDMNALLVDLQDISPYLSYEVLQSIVQQSSISISNVIAFAVANPEVLRSSDLMEYLQMQRTLSNNQISLLEQAANNSYTVRHEVERQLYSYYASMQHAGHTLIIDVLADSGDAIDMATFKNRLDLQDGLSSDYNKVELHYELGEMSQATTLLQDIETDRIKPGYLQSEYDNYEILKNMHTQLLTAGEGWNDLDMIEINQLELLALQKQERAGAQARQILNMLYGYEYLNLPVLTVEGEAQAAEGESLLTEQGLSINNSTDAFLKAMPNPASYQVKFNYAVDVNTPFVMLQMLDFTGKPVLKKRLIGAMGEYSWNIPTSLPGGVYLYTLNYGEQQLPMQRLVLLK